MYSKDRYGSMFDIETAAHVSDVVHGPFFASLGVWYFPYCLLFSVLSVIFIMVGPIYILSNMCILSV